jgi:hypothetical protein
VKNNVEDLWKAQEGPQAEFCQRQEYEILYGGAAGGGKSDALLMEGLRQVSHPQYRALYVRRTFPNLQKVIDRSYEIFPKIGGKWNGEAKRWVFPSGAIYKFGHMKDEKDKHNYQSDEYAYIAFDELTQFSESQYIYLHSRNRTPAKDIDCYIRSASNPGNTGHAWVKRRFIDQCRPYETHRDPETGLTRAFIPAKVYDNRILVEADPLYIKRLESLPENERRMLLDGDWNVFAGQAFGEIRTGTHIIPSFKLHPGWFRFAALDWGYARPYSIGFYATTGEILIRFSEKYGWNGSPNEGSKEVASKVARDTHKRANLLGITDMVADPSCWQKAGHDGPSIAEAFEEVGFRMHKGENNRLLGKSRLHQLLGDRDEHDRPLLLVFDNCFQWVRTMPELVLDEKNPEDVDTTGEDHIYDETRYAVMSDLIYRKPNLGIKNHERHWRGAVNATGNENTSWMSG